MDAKKISDLVLDLEKSSSDCANELGEIKATMIVNFSGKNKLMPTLLDGTEKTALQMFMKIVDHYCIAREGQADQQNTNSLHKHDVSSSVCTCGLTHENCDCIDTGICERCNKPILQTDC